MCIHMSLFFMYCSMSVCVFFVFFFFKQKTAYEMRISDWSSDVCSSDLACQAARAVLRGLGPSVGGVVLVGALGQRAGQPVHIGDGGEMLGHQIGRASCRERVCQYV